MPPRFTPLPCQTLHPSGVQSLKITSISKHILPVARESQSGLIIVGSWRAPLSSLQISGVLERSHQFKYMWDRL